MSSALHLYWYGGITKLGLANGPGDVRRTSLIGPIIRIISRTIRGNQITILESN